MYYLLKSFFEFFLERMIWKFLVLLIIALVIPDVWCFWRPSKHCRKITERYSVIHYKDDLHELAKVWAPAVKLAKDEKWKPSSVDFFLEHVELKGQRFNDPLTASNLPRCNRNCYLKTKRRLNCASCTNLSFLRGQSSSRVPVYVFITIRME